MPQRPYGLLCPISHASELLGPRWTMQILSELWSGSSRFNDIRRGVGNISSGLLSKRLKQLEAAGLIERVEDKRAGTVDYIRTDKAVKLEPALNALAEWAQCNIDADMALRDTDVSALMWAVRRKVKLPELPPRRVVIRFDFTSQKTADGYHYWLVAQPGATLPGLCITDPGIETNLFVETDVVSLAGILTGRSTIEREIEQGRLVLSGDPRLARTMHLWLRRTVYAEIEGIAKLPDRGDLRVRVPY